MNSALAGHGLLRRSWPSRGPGDGRGRSPAAENGGLRLSGDGRRCCRRSRWGCSVLPPARSTVLAFLVPFGAWRGYLAWHAHTARMAVERPADRDHRTLRHHRPPSCTPGGKHARPFALACRTWPCRLAGRPVHRRRRRDRAPRGRRDARRPRARRAGRLLAGRRGRRGHHPRRSGNWPTVCGPNAPSAASSTPNSPDSSLGVVAGTAAGGRADHRLRHGALADPHAPLGARRDLPGPGDRVCPGGDDPPPASPGSAEALSAPLLGVAFTGARGRGLGRFVSAPPAERQQNHPARRLAFLAARDGPAGPARRRLRASFLKHLRHNPGARPRHAVSGRAKRRRAYVPSPRTRRPRAWHPCCSAARRRGGGVLPVSAGPARQPRRAGRGRVPTGSKRSRTCSGSAATRSPPGGWVAGEPGLRPVAEAIGRAGLLRGAPPGRRDPGLRDGPAQGTAPDRRQAPRRAPGRRPARRPVPPAFVLIGLVPIVLGLAHHLL